MDTFVPLNDVDDVAVFARWIPTHTRRSETKVRGHSVVEGMEPLAHKLSIKCQHNAKWKWILASDYNHRWRYEVSCSFWISLFLRVSCRHRAHDLINIVAGKVHAKTWWLDLHSRAWVGAWLNAILEMRAFCWLFCESCISVCACGRLLVVNTNIVC